MAFVLLFTNEIVHPQHGFACGSFIYVSGRAGLWVIMGFIDSGEVYDYGIRYSICFGRYPVRAREAGACRTFNVAVDFAAAT